MSESQNIKLRAQSHNLLGSLQFIFILLQPLIDNYYLLNDKAPQFAGMTIPTILRYSLVGLMLLLALRDRTVRQASKPLWIFLGLSLLFLAAHLYFNRNFESLMDTDPYRVSGEIAYVLRLVTPLVFFFVAWQKPLPRRHFIRAIQAVVLVTLLMLLVSNLSLTSLGSYNNETIRGNILSWFTGGRKLVYAQLASKAWFNFANQLSAYLLMLLPLILYSAVAERSILSVVLLIGAGPGLLMIGTKVATLGYFLVLALWLLVCIYHLISVRHGRKYVGVLLLLSVVLLLGAWQVYPYTPAAQRELSSAAVIQEQQGKHFREALEAYPSSFVTPPSNDMIMAYQSLRDGDLSALLTEYNREEKTQILARFLPGSLIDKYYYNISYNYRNDTDFWLSMLVQPAELQKENRYVQVAMLERVKAVNGKTSDSLFGIGNSRVQGIFNIERDFVNQYFSVGLIGLLLFLAIYPIGALFVAFWIVRKLRQRFKLFYLMCGTTLGILPLISLLSGNLMDSLLITLTLAFVAGQCFSAMRQAERRETGPDSPDNAAVEADLP